MVHAPPTRTGRGWLENGTRLSPRDNLKELHFPPSLQIMLLVFLIQFFFFSPTTPLRGEAFRVELLRVQHGVIELPRCFLADVQVAVSKGTAK